MNHSRAVVCWIAVFVSLPVPAIAEDEHPLEIKCSDGFVLDGKIRLPESTTPDQVKRVIVLIHGSGQHSMDQDLTAVTRGHKENLFFRDLAAALSDTGFAVLRYNKRGYQLREKLREEPDFKNSQIYQATTTNPLRLFVEDAKDCVALASDKFPGAKVFLLGHSQGTYIALQVARQMPAVRGVALIGFAQWSTDVLVFEQSVYRALGMFNELDRNSDGAIDKNELAAPAATSLRAQVAVLDLDHDQLISQMEFKAGSLSALLSTDMFKIFREQEATYPRSSEILQAAEFKVVMFQGLLDNQTPAYHAKAVELLNRHSWKKENLQFHYFPGLGHALDSRASYFDLTYDTISPNALETIKRQLGRSF